MNKKFSTLMAGVLLATSMGVTAQNDHGGRGEILYRSDLVKSAVTSFHCNGVTEIDSEKWYQLAVTDGAVEPENPDAGGDQGQVGADATVLTMERDYETGELHLEVKTIEKAALTHSLWKIVYEKDAVSGKKFTFVNKETGYALTFDHTNALNLNGAADAEAAVADEDATILNGCNDIWEWYTTDKQTTRFAPKLAYSYFHNTDSVMALAKNANGEVVLVKESKANALDDLSAITNLIKLQPVMAGAKVLNAAELNSMIDADGSYQGFGDPVIENEVVKFKFNVELANNPLAAEKGYLAEASSITALRRDNYEAGKAVITAGQKSVYAGYDIVFKSLTNSDSYLKVTTDYHEGETTGNYNGLILKDVTYANTATAIDADNSRFHFKVTYYPTNDSLVIEPLNATMPNNDGTIAENLAPENYLNTINAGVAYGSAAGVPNCLYNKAAGVPVALASMNFAGTGVDAKKVLTISTPYGINADEAKYAAICKEDYACAASTDAKNPAFVTFNCDAHGNKDPKVEYNANMAVKISFDNNYTYLKRTSLENGVYLITLSTGLPYKHDAISTEKRADGSYIVADMGGHLVYDVKEESQVFENMPATQWVVERLNCNVYANDVTVNKAPLVKISNREYGIEGFVGQLYDAGDGKCYFINHTPYADGMNSTGADSGNHSSSDYFSCGDTLVFHKITPNQEGYAVIPNDVLKETVFAFQHAFDNAGGLFLGVNTTDSYLQAMTGDETYYELHLISEAANYGYTSALAGADQLKRSAYVVKVKDANKIDNDHKYVAVDHMYRYVVADEADIQAGKDGLRWAVFYLKENNNLASTPYYALVNATDLKEYGKLKHVNHTAGKLAIEAISKKSKIDGLCGTSTDVFALTIDPRPLYKTLNAEYVNNLNKSVTLSTGYGNEYLFEDSKSGILNYLAVENKSVQTTHEALYADYVAKSKERMPQYLFAVAADSVKPYYYCGENAHGAIHGLNPSCDHKVLYPGYVSGRFLVNLNDSIQNSINKVENPSKFQHDNYTRLAFVEAVHRGDSLYVLKAPYTLKGANAITGTDANGNVLIVPDSLAKEKEGIIYDIVELNGNHNNVAFSLRYVGDTEEEGFLLESYDVAHANAENSLSAIGSFEGAWVRIVNGVPVIAKFYNANGNHNTDDFVNGNDGWTSIGSFDQVLNQAAILTLGETDKVATSNDAIDASSVSVIATEGAVIIKGAAGKKVSIVNVLGQTIANTVVTSDEATIAAPAGVVVVSVEGEAAVKAIVK